MFRARAVCESFHHGAEGIGRQDVRERIEESGDAGSRHRLPDGRGSVVWFGEMVHGDFAAAIVDGNCAKAAEI